MTDGSLALTLLRAAVSLAVVLGLLVLCLRVLARRSGYTAPGRTAVDVEVLGRRQLSRSASVQVVRVGDDVLVLGVTDAHISTLHRLSGEDVAADEGEGPAPTGRDTPANPILADALRRQGAIGRLVADAAGRGGRRGRHRAAVVAASTPTDETAIETPGGSTA